jgi:hypothetical protein
MVHVEILKQLGGQRFLMMTGAKNLLYSAKDNNFLSMHLTKNKIGAKYLKIVLRGDDTYTMIFSTIKKIKDENYPIKVDTHVILKTIEGVYCDMLQEIFTDVTGLYTSLGTMGK